VSKPRKAPAHGLLVLGMHRSGTSALSRVLGLCGFDLGQRLLAAGPGNETGHWEDAFAVDLHERLLAAHGAAWNDALVLPSDWLQAETGRDAVAEITGYLRSNRASHPRWSVKDPRLCLFAPAWQAAAAQAGQPLSAVLMLRHPMEVALSLAARDGLPLGSGLLLWLEYSLSALDAAASMPAVVVDYPTLLRDWRAVVARVAGLPGFSGLAPDSLAAGEVEAFLDAGRRHQSAADAAPLPAAVATAWQALQACLASGEVVPGTADILRGQLAPLRELLHPVLDDWRASRRQLWQRVARAEAGLADDALRLPPLLQELTRGIESNRIGLVDAVSVELRRMQDMVGHAQASAASREREAQLAAELGPRLDTLSSLLAPMPDRLGGEIHALAEGIEANRVGLLDAVGVELRRMQDMVGLAQASAASREREAQMAAELGPRLDTLSSLLAPLPDRLGGEIHALAEGIEANRTGLMDAVGVELRRMQDMVGQAQASAASREREAQLAAELGPRLQQLETALSAGLAPRLDSLAALVAPLPDRLGGEIRALAAGIEANRAGLVEAISTDLRRMQEVVTQARVDAALQAERADEATRSIDRIRDHMEASLQAAESALATSLANGHTLQESILALEQSGARMEARHSEDLEKLAQAHARTQQLSADVAALKYELDQLRDIARQFEQVRQSRSWRWTRPLRALARLAKGEFGASDRANLRRALGRKPEGFVVRDQPVGEMDGPPMQVIGPAQLPDAEEAVAIALAPALAGLEDVFIWSVIDWHFRFQRPQHIARALAQKGHRVFYISNNFNDSASPGFHIESLGCEDRLFQVHLNLEGRPPIYFGMPTTAQVEAMRASLAGLLAWTCTRTSVSLVQHPYWSPLVRAVPSARVIYDCMDHHGGFENNAPAVIEAESHLVQDADLVVVTSAWLEQEVAPRARATAMVRNAGDFEFFRTAPAQVFADPEGRRVIGYFGAIAEWFDVELVRRIALARPDCLVLLVGNDTAGAGDALADLPNVRLTGEVPYLQLPYWLHGFDVCLLPFRVIPLTLATNPVKVYEYLAAGKPVVSVDLPEMAQFDGLVRIGADGPSFVAQVEAALAEPPGSGAISRQDFAAHQTWAHRAEALDQALAALPEQRVSVIVLTYNNLAFTEACLFSLEAYSDYRNLEVIVVDNASSDGSREWLSDWVAQPSAAGHERRLILNDANLGFSAGNNVGLRVATGEVLILLNNDTYVTPGWVRGLCNHLRDEPRLGLLGPVTNNIGNEARIAIGYTDMAQMIAEAGRFTRAHPGQRTPMRTAAFFCVAMRREVYERIGDMDEDFGVGFFEDDDYSRRIEGAGLQVACADDVFIHHHLSASFDAMKAEKKQELFERNKAIYESKWGAWVPHVYRSNH
jgi:GT2 family glycosyltransferase/glycosyltransferase involved in cell wall biosynthesis